jgi:hypothetical protein
MYKIKNWILNHKVAVGITLVLFTPLVTVVFGAIGLLFSAVFAVLGFVFGMFIKQNRAFYAEKDNDAIEWQSSAEKAPKFNGVYHSYTV